MFSALMVTGRKPPCLCTTLDLDDPMDDLDDLAAGHSILMYYVILNRRFP